MILGRDNIRIRGGGRLLALHGIRTSSATLDPLDELAPKATLILTHTLERLPELLRRTAPHASVAAHSRLDVTAVEDAFERAPLRERRLRRDEHVHLLEACRELEYGVVVRPPLYQRERLKGELGGRAVGGGRRCLLGGTGHGGVDCDEWAWEGDWAGGWHERSFAVGWR